IFSRIPSAAFGSVMGLVAPFYASFEVAKIHVSEVILQGNILSIPSFSSAIEAFSSILDYMNVGIVIDTVIEGTRRGYYDSWGGVFHFMNEYAEQGERVLSTHYRRDV